MTEHTPHSVQDDFAEVRAGLTWAARKDTKRAALRRIEEQVGTYEKALRDIYEFEKDGTHVSEIAREALDIRPPWAP